MTQQPYSRHPRPAGGNGGDGGDGILFVDAQLATLLDFQFRHEFHASRGRHGSGNNKTGKRGDDCVIHVPLGTTVFDADTGRVLRDLTREGERVVIVRGGVGGFGNANASRATPGKPGARRRLRLELKLIADVGLIGFPNAGKSSLLRQISTAKPKVASYPFTTRSPVLGVVSVGPYDPVSPRSFVACDIPGLIEGAHTGRGLGIQFLRHIERTRLLIHVIDMAALDDRDPIERFSQINEELSAYHSSLGRRPQLIAGNKMDLPDSAAHLRRLQHHVGEDQVFPISCATGKGIPALVEAAWQRLRAL